jgi:hypothetical protein
MALRSQVPPGQAFLTRIVISREQFAANFPVRARWPSPSLRNAAQARLSQLILANYLCGQFSMRSRRCACDVRDDRRSPNPFPGVANLHGEMEAFSPPSE